MIFVSVNQLCLLFFFSVLNNKIIQKKSDVISRDGMKVRLHCRFYIFGALLNPLADFDANVVLIFFSITSLRRRISRYNVNCLKSTFTKVPPAYLQKKWQVESW